MSLTQYKRYWIEKHRNISESSLVKAVKKISVKIDWFLEKKNVSLDFYYDGTIKK